MATTDYISAQGLPANIEAERSILGAILLDNLSYNQAAEHLKPEDFLLDSHRRIYSRKNSTEKVSSKPSAGTPIWQACSMVFLTGRASSTTSRLSAIRRCCAD